MTDCENKQIAFFGKITAGITHEMKNVLATIKESSGLMEDLILLCSKTPLPYGEKMQRALSTINEQVQRGVELTSRLNRFAHDPEETVKKIDLQDMVEHLIALAQRFARLQNVILKSVTSSPPVLIETRPVQLQMALFGGIECCLNLMATGGRISLCPQKQGEDNLVHIFCEGDALEKISFVGPGPGSTSEKWLTLNALVKNIGGSVLPDESSRGIYIFLPDNIHSHPPA